MEKRVYMLRIDLEFHDLIPPLSGDEYRLLEESILRVGCDTPLIVWNGTIVDGHNRYEICHKHNIPFAVEEKEFDDRDSAMFWMLERQLARRNLSPYARVKLAEKFEPMFKQRAQRRILAGKTIDPPQNSAEGAYKGETRDALAKIAGVSHDTVAKVKKIDQGADEETKEALKKGEISINKAYTQVVNREHEGETRVCKKCGQEKPYSDYRIPSNLTNYRPICIECENEEKAEAAREANPAITGIDVKDGQVAHVFVGLPDTPEEFQHVINLLESAQNYYISAFRTLIQQYQPSMISEENTKKLQSMIKETNKKISAMLNERIKEVL